MSDLQKIVVSGLARKVMFPYKPSLMNFAPLKKAENGTWGYMDRMWQCRDYYGDFLASYAASSEVIDKDRMRFLIVFSSASPDKKKSFLNNVNILHEAEEETNPGGIKTLFFDPVFDGIKDTQTAEGSLVVEADAVWQRAIPANSFFLLLIRILSQAKKGQSWRDIVAERGDDREYMERLRKKDIRGIFPQMSLLAERYGTRTLLREPADYCHGISGIVSYISTMDALVKLSDVDREFLGADMFHEITIPSWGQ